LREESCTDLDTLLRLWDRTWPRWRRLSRKSDD